MQGQLGDKVISDLIREIAQKKASGLLRLSRGKTIKAIFFNDGAPVFAISNLTTEQLDHKLIKDGLATFDQIEQGKHRVGKANRLGSALVEMGVLADDLMRKVVREQVMQIIMSLFEWDQGDFSFDERIRATHDVTLDCSAFDIILEGTRHAASLTQVARLIAPDDSLIVRSKSNGISMDTGKLMPLESYVLSRIDSPTTVSEVGSVSGISDEDAHRAVCALVAAGFLRLVGGHGAEETAVIEDDSLERFREDVVRKVHFFISADFYDILEVSRSATTTDIKTSYYQLAKRFHPDLYRQPEAADIRGKLEALFARVTEAYDTLSDPARRATYNETLKKPNPHISNVPRKKTGPIVPLEDRTPAAPQVEQAKITGPLQPQPAEPAGGASQSKASNQQVTLSAEQYYQQGRARYDRREYHAAVHLLREAVKLDPSRPNYHFHLGIALIRNPRARREAEAHLTKAAELDPYNSQMRVKLALLYKEAGLSKKAEHYFKEAMSLDPDNRVARRELGMDVKKVKLPSIWKSDLGSIKKRIFKK